MEEILVSGYKAKQSINKYDSVTIATEGGELKGKR